MNSQKKRKIKKWIKNHIKVLVGTGIFVLTGLVALLIGFEITNDWHAIRNWLASPSSATFFIIAVVGAFVLIILIVLVSNLHRGDDI